jgi:hypothetical protein
MRCAGRAPLRGWRAARRCAGGPPPAEGRCTRAPSQLCVTRGLRRCAGGAPRPRTVLTVRWAGSRAAARVARPGNPLRGSCAAARVARHPRKGAAPAHRPNCALRGVFAAARVARPGASAVRVARRCAGRAPLRGWRAARGRAPRPRTVLTVRWAGSRGAARVARPENELCGSRAGGAPGGVRCAGRAPLRGWPAARGRAPRPRSACSLHACSSAQRLRGAVELCGSPAQGVSGIGDACRARPGP